MHFGLFSTFYCQQINNELLYKILQVFKQIFFLFVNPTFIVGCIERTLNKAFFSWLFISRSHGKQNWFVKVIIVLKKTILKLNWPLEQKIMIREKLKISCFWINNQWHIILKGIYCQIYLHLFNLQDLQVNNSSTMLFILFWQN